MKVLFVRRVKKISGGQVKVRDYFAHCMAHPALDPYVYFTADTKPRAEWLWADVPPERRVERFDVADYDLLFVEGRDWELLPDELPANNVINFVQHVRHADPDNKRFPFLSRPALRICVGEAVREAIAPYAAGDVAVIPNGIPLELFAGAVAAKRPGSVLLWARKQPELGERLRSSLAKQGVDAIALVRVTPREEFARALAETDVFAGLPDATEGFYLPALEAMAAGCAVVCADAAGNRDFCIDGETCLMPPDGDLDGHLRAIERLLTDSELRERLRSRGREMAQRYSLDKERARFHALLEERYPELRSAISQRTAHG